MRGSRRSPGLLTIIKICMSLILVLSGSGGWSSACRPVYFLTSSSSIIITPTILINHIVFTIHILASLLPFVLHLTNRIYPPRMASSRASREIQVSRCRRRLDPPTEHGLSSNFHAWISRRRVSNTSPINHPTPHLRIPQHVMPRSLLIPG